MKVNYNFGIHHPLNTVIPHIVHWGLEELGIQDKKGKIWVNTFFDEETDVGGKASKDPLLKSYNVDINLDHDIELLAMTVLHELIHVRQYVMGTLKPRFYGWNWLGKFYFHKTTKYPNDMPWEDEAYTVAPLLSFKYNEEYLNEKDV